MVWLLKRSQTDWLLGMCRTMVSWVANPEESWRCLLCGQVEIGEQPVSVAMVRCSTSTMRGSYDTTHGPPYRFVSLIQMKLSRWKLYSFFDQKMFHGCVRTFSTPRLPAAAPSSRAASTWMARMSSKNPDIHSLICLFGCNFPGLDLSFGFIWYQALPSYTKLQQVEVLPPSEGTLDFSQKLGVREGVPSS